jgi:PAS domain S-box-containing protein
VQQKDSSQGEGTDEQLYRLMVESSTGYAIFSIDMEGKLLSWNSGSMRIFGYTAEEVIGQDAAVLFTPEDRGEGIPDWEIEQALSRGRAFNQRWHMRKDSSRFWADGMLMPLRDRFGRTSGFLKVMREAPDIRQMLDVLSQHADADLKAINGYPLDPDGEPRGVGDENVSG